MRVRLIGGPRMGQVLDVADGSRELVVARPLDWQHGLISSPRLDWSIKSNLEFGRYTPSRRSDYWAFRGWRQHG